MRGRARRLRIKRGRPTAQPWFREKGCGAVHVEVFAQTETGRRFCEHFGYKALDIHQIKPLDSSA